MSRYSNDRDFSNMMNSGELPVGGTLPNNGFDEDFAKVLGAQSGRQGSDVPPLHPGKRVEITDEEYEEILRKKQDPATLFAGTQFRSEYHQYSLSDKDEREKLQNVINNCLQKGWILAKEEWHRTQEGNTIIAIKCLVPLPKKKQTVEKKGE